MAERPIPSETMKMMFFLVLYLIGMASIKAAKIKTRTAVGSLIVDSMCAVDRYCEAIDNLSFREKPCRAAEVENWMALYTFSHQGCTTEKD